MTSQTAEKIVHGASADWDRTNLPPRILEIVDRQREHLLSLANSLLALDKSEAEVLKLIETAAKNFNNTLEAQLTNGE